MGRKWTCLPTDCCVVRSTDPGASVVSRGMRLLSQQMSSSMNAKYWRFLILMPCDCSLSFRKPLLRVNKFTKGLRLSLEEVQRNYNCYVYDITTSNVRQQVVSIDIGNTCRYGQSGSLFQACINTNQVITLR